MLIWRFRCRARAFEIAPWLRATLACSATKHAGCRVTPEMYAWVGDSLLATARRGQRAGAEWIA
jgi:hemoglobin-like flavoprotein